MPICREMRWIWKEATRQLEIFSEMQWKFQYKGNYSEQRTCSEMLGKFSSAKAENNDMQSASRKAKETRRRTESKQPGITRDSSSSSSSSRTAAKLFCHALTIRTGYVRCCWTVGICILGRYQLYHTRWLSSLGWQQALPEDTPKVKGCACRDCTNMMGEPSRGS